MFTSLSFVFFDVFFDVFFGDFFIFDWLIYYWIMFINEIGFCCRVMNVSVRSGV